MKLVAFLFFLVSRKYWTAAQVIIGVPSQYAEGQTVPAGTSIRAYTPPNIINVTSLVEARNAIPNMRFLIYNYNAPLVQLTQNLSIPYLVIPEVGNNIALPNNVFYMSSIQQQSLECTQALLAQLNASSAVFVDYQPEPQLRSLLGFLNISQTLFEITDSTDMRSIFVGQLLLNTENFYVSAIPLSKTVVITNLLMEAMIKGQLNPGKVWIFMNVDISPGNFTVFLPFVNVGATIYCFSINRLGLTADTFLNSVVADYIALIGRVVAGGLTNQILALGNTPLVGGILADYAKFNPVTRKYNGTIIEVMKANSATPQRMYIYNSILSPTQPSSLANKLSDPSVVVRIGVVLSKGYFMVNPAGQYYGYSMGMLTKLHNLVNFNYRFVLENRTLNDNQSHSQQLNNLLETNQADLILIPMVESLVSSQADKSDVVLTMTISMLTRPPDVILSSISLAPFSYNMWCGILIIIILLTFGFWAVSALNPPLEGDSKNKQYSFGYCFLVIYSSFAMAKLKVKLLAPSSQIFAFILWFSTLTVIIAYASNMLPYLMKTIVIYPFQNASYFINVTNLAIFDFVKNSDDIRLIQNDSVLSVLYNRSLESSRNMFVDDLTSESILLSNKHYLLQNSFKNNYIYNSLNCTANVFAGSNIPYPMVFAINRNWILKDQMKGLITTLINTEVANSLEINYFSKGPCANSVVSLRPSAVPLSLNKLFILFLFPLCGIIFGVSYVVLFIVCGKLCRCVKNSKREKFVVGQTYDAKVSSLETNGVWAFINQRDRPYFVHSSSLHPDLRKQYSPKELEIKSGDVLHLKYFGKDPINKYKRFCKDFTDA